MNKISLFVFLEVVSVTIPYHLTYIMNLLDPKTRIEVVNVSILLNSSKDLVTWIKDLYCYYGKMYVHNQVRR